MDSTFTPLIVGLLPELTLNEFLFAFIIFVAAICILFKIQPVAIMGGVLFIWIIVIVDFAGLTPITVVLILLALAMVRVLADAAVHTKNDPETQVTLLRILEFILRRRSPSNDDRGND